MTTLLTTAKLETMRKRRGAGESMAALAKEAGLSWQRLWGLLYSDTRRAPRSVKLMARAGARALTEKYRPVNLAGIRGQDKVVKVLRQFANDPYPAAFLFEGLTGTGKTSVALALAAELGCVEEQQEFGGVHIISSGEQSADHVRATTRLMHAMPFYGSGWKVVIVNEVDRMHRAAETIWLDRLEALPARTVVVFTTNYGSALSDRFADRCIRLRFESGAIELRADGADLVRAIWKAETRKSPPAKVVRAILEASQRGESLSFRRVVQETAVAIEERRV